MLFGKTDYWSLLCRGRKKKIVILIAIILFFLNFLVFVEVSNLRKRVKIMWYERLVADRKSTKSENGMKVIVGRYVGGYENGSLSDEILHRNNYAPIPFAGDDGLPVVIPQREYVSAHELYMMHSYNIMVGDKISIERRLPDIRSDSCKQVVYDLNNLPTATVVIVFHNEAWSTLMRTVMSVINRSPQNLLKEVILVDDASDRRYLGKELDDAVAELKQVQIIRSKNRTGLVGARLMGAKAATGDVLVFLDAHCEVTPVWLEPLLDRAGSDDVFICPHIDLLSDETFAYSKSIEAHWGAFSWHLHFRWLMPSKDIIDKKAANPSKPYPTPTMAGGLFAVRKSLFWRLGGYDKGMKIWGGENLELSWRAWQCGARVEITSCSRVGHIFRRHSPYKFPGGVGKVLDTNLARAATVWMDDWAEFFFKFNPSAAAIRDKMLVGDRVALRESLNCKSFDWYLKNVWPQHFFPTDDRWFGRIKNDRGACLCAPEQQSGMGGPAAGVSCGHDTELSKLLVYTPEGRIMADEGLCLQQGNGRALWKSCSDNEKQIWKQKGPRLKNIDKKCLTLVPNDKNLNRSGVDDEITSLRCGSTEGQIWHFERVPWK